LSAGTDGLCVERYSGSPSQLGAVLSVVARQESGPSSDQQTVSAVSHFNELAANGHSWEAWGKHLKGIRDALKRERQGRVIVAKQCPHCTKWFTTRLRSRVLCLRCETNEGHTASR